GRKREEWGGADGPLPTSVATVRSAGAGADDAQRHLAGDGGGRLDLPAESLAIDDRPARSDVDSRDRSQGIVELGQIDRQTDEVSDDRQLDPVEVDQAQFGVEPARQGDLPRLTERLVGAAQVDEAGVLGESPQLDGIGSQSASRSRRSLRTLWSLRSLRSLRSRITLVALVALRPLRAGITLRSLRSLRSLRALGALRAGHAPVLFGFLFRHVLVGGVVLCQVLVGGVHSGQELGGVHTVEQPGVDRTRLGEALEEGCHLAPGGVVVGAVSVVGGWVAAAGYPVVLHPLDVAPEQVVLGDVRERGCGVGGAGAQHRDRRDRGDEDQRSSPVAWWLSHSGLSLHVVPSPPDLAGEYRGRSIPDHHPAGGSKEESAESRRGGAVESCRRCAGIKSSAHSRHYRCEEGEGPETQDWSMSRRLLLVATVVDRK